MLVKEEIKEKGMENKATGYVKYPEQTKELEEIMETLRHILIVKNQDYSPWNMLGTGEVGSVVRIWDKTARLMNLYGFDIATGTFTGQKSPKNESIEDNLLDLANYAIISLLLLRGKWGK
jgi:hypothetical protein